jgi:hypothetical protein
VIRFVRVLVRQSLEFYLRLIRFLFVRTIRQDTRPILIDGSSMVRSPSRHMEPDRLPLLILQLVTPVLRVTSRKLRQSPNKFHQRQRESSERERRKNMLPPVARSALGHPASPAAQAQQEGDRRREAGRAVPTEPGGVCGLRHWALRHPHRAVPPREPPHLLRGHPRPLLLSAGEEASHGRRARRCC